jgi:hypothetical protein
MTDSAARLSAAAAVIGIALAAALVWAALPGPSKDNCNGGGLGGTALTFNTPEEQAIGSDHWYNFSIGAASSGLSLGNLNFQIQTSSGAPVTPGGGWTLTISKVGNATVASYSLTGASADTWTLGGSVPISSLETVDLLTTPDGISGDTLVAAYAGPVSGGCRSAGSISTSVP